MNEDNLLITDAEWRAILRGTIALRQVGAFWRRMGSNVLATEFERDASQLIALSHRATVAATREQPAVAPEAEAETEVER